MILSVQLIRPIAPAPLRQNYALSVSTVIPTAFPRRAIPGPVSPGAKKASQNESWTLLGEAGMRQVTGDLAQSWSPRAEPTSAANAGSGASCDVIGMMEPMEHLKNSSIVW